MTSFLFPPSSDTVSRDTHRPTEIKPPPEINVHWLTPEAGMAAGQTNSWGLVRELDRRGGRESSGAVGAAGDESAGIYREKKKKTRTTTRTRTTTTTTGNGKRNEEARKEEDEEDEEDEEEEVGDASALIMVGDSIDDMTAGRRAGAATVLLVNDANRDLADHPHTDLVIGRLDDLIAVLDDGFVGREIAPAAPVVAGAGAGAGVTNGGGSSS